MSIGDALTVFFIFAALAALAVYAWTDLTRLIREQLLDELWAEDEVGAGVSAGRVALGRGAVAPGLTANAGADTTPGGAA